MSPYVFPIALALLGLWCLYDGWFTSNPEMQKHHMFNKIASLTLLPWAAIDFIRTRKREKLYAQEQEALTNQKDHRPDTPENESGDQ